MGPMEIPTGPLSAHRPLDSPPYRGEGVRVLRCRASSLPRGRWKIIALSFEGIVIAAILGLSCGPLWALDPHKEIGQYGHDSWTSQRGLPGEAVYQILQSRDGYLWVRTGSGLARFDGVRFVSMDAEIANDPVKAICMSADGDLMIRTTSRTVIYRNGQFSDYLPPGALPDGDTLAVFESSKHAVLLGSDDFLYTLEKSGPRLLRGDTSIVNSFVEDRNGTVWIGGTTGIFTYSNGKLSKPSGVGVSSLLEDHLHRIWGGSTSAITGQTSGIYRLDDGQPHPELTSLPGLTGAVLSLIEDREGSIWVATSSSGVGRLRNGTTSSLDALEGLTDNKVNVLFEDREGSIWVGTASGLDRFRDTSLTTFTAKEGLPTNAVTAALQTRDGILHVFTDGGGLARIENDVITTFEHNAALPAVWGHAMFESRDGSLWIGAGKGLSRLKNGKLTVYAGDGHFSRHYISAISEDDESLVVGNDEIGTFRVTDDGKVLPFTIRGRANELTWPGLYVFTMYHDPSGTLWMGTPKGIFKFVRGGSSTDGLQPSIQFAVTSIFDDGLGSLWLGGRTSGITQFRIRDGRVTHYTKRDGLFDVWASRTLGDDGGNLWISTQDGIYSVARSSLEDFAEGRTQHVLSRKYGLADGMKTVEASDPLSQPGGWRTADGRLWFTTKKGIVVVDPRHMVHNALIPPVVVETVITDGTVWPLAAEVRIPPGARDIEFHYTALSLAVPERVRFKYRLEGYNADWVDAGSRRVAYYSNLRPARYRFHVIAANDDGVWNEQGASINILLAPRFYQTWPFYAGCVLLALLAIVAGNHLSTRLIRLRATELGRLVEEKTAELQESQRELEHLAHSDALTSLANRRLFNQFLAKLLALAQRQKKTFALLLIDFDKFKQINDNFGHDAGDAFLIEASIRLQAAIRCSDCVARLGGDEFAILLSNDPEEAGIAKVCHLILQSFDAPVRFRAVEIHSSASIGVAVFPQHGHTQESLYKCADLALYEAKRRGRNNWRQYRPEDGREQAEEIASRIR
jgi:diguanylate cyclase (GGDEF)-like protein